MFHTLLRRLRGLLELSRGSELAPTHVRRLDRADDRLSGEVTLVERLSDGDCILCVAGDVIPCRGMVVDGFASIRYGSSEPPPNDSENQILRGGLSVLPGMTIATNYLIVRIEESATAGRRPAPRAARAHR